MSLYPLPEYVKICHCIHYQYLGHISNTWARKDSVTSYCTKYPLCIGSGVGDLLNMVDVYATIKWQEKRKKGGQGRREDKSKKTKKHNREDKSKSCKKWEALQPHWPFRNIKRNKGSPFLKCVFSKWALPERGCVCERLASMVWSTFFPRMAKGVKAC